MNECESGLSCQVFKVATRHPGDVAGVTGLLEGSEVRAEDIVAIFGKTEGNGCVNDFTRAYAVSALSATLAEHLGCAPSDVASRVAMVMSGGTEGGLSPHLLIFARTAGPVTVDRPLRKSLAIGVAFTRPFRPEEIGRMAQVEATALAVRQAIRDADISDDDDVHFVQVKCPLLTSERVTEATARGMDVATRDTYDSMGLSRGASALGVALALGEVDRNALSDDVVCRRRDLYSSRASASSGIELMRNEIVVLGNSASWSSEDGIAHRVMQDAIDLPALVGALADLGFATNGQLDTDSARDVKAVLAKAEPSRSGLIRGARHIMWDDSDIHATRHARALVGGVASAVIGRTDLFVSGGAEHQGPDGGGPIAVIARRRDDATEAI